MRDKIVDEHLMYLSSIEETITCFAIVVVVHRMRQATNKFELMAIVEKFVEEK